jgi:hypothetical protein
MYNRRFRRCGRNTRELSKGILPGGGLRGKFQQQRPITASAEYTTDVAIYTRLRRLAEDRGDLQKIGAI